MTPDQVRTLLAQGGEGHEGLCINYDGQDPDDYNDIDDTCCRHMAAASERSIAVGDAYEQVFVEREAYEGACADLAQANVAEVRALRKVIAVMTAARERQARE